MNVAMGRNGEREETRPGRSCRWRRRPGIGGTRSFALARGTLLCLSLLLGAGCSDDDSGTGPGSNGPPYDDGRLTFPLSVGNEWTYAADEPEGEGRQGESGFSTRIIGTRIIGGETYASVVDTSPDLSDTTHVRQSGSNVFIYPAAFLRPAPDPLTQWLQENVGPTLPWRSIDFEAEKGESWLIGEAQGDVEIDGALASVAGSVRVEALGTSPVSTPAGDFDTAYRFRVTQDIDIRFEIDIINDDIHQEILSAQTVSVVDDIGVVLEESEESLILNGGEPLVTRSTLVLQSFQVAAP